MDTHIFVCCGFSQSQPLILHPFADLNDVGKLIVELNDRLCSVTLVLRRTNVQRNESSASFQSL